MVNIRKRDLDERIYFEINYKYLTAKRYNETFKVLKDDINHLQEIKEE